MDEIHKLSISKLKLDYMLYFQSKTPLGMPLRISRQRNLQQVHIWVYKLRIFRSDQTSHKIK